MSDTSSYLARITAVDDRNGGQVLSVTSLWTHSTLMVLFQAGWTFVMLWGLILGGNHVSLGISLTVLAFAWMATQFLFVFTYPEWPLNRLLCRRLRRSVARRSEPLVAAGR